MAIAAQVNRRTTISTAIVSSSTTFTLTSGVFDTFSDDYLVLDYDNPSLLEVVRCSVSGTTVTITARAQDGTSAQDHAIGAKVAWDLVKSHINSLPTLPDTSYYNLLKNGNFHNASTNGYGTTPDDWTNSSANPVQGGFPTFTKQQCIDLLGVTTGQIAGLWNLNGNFTDLSDSAYNLTPSGSPADSSDGLMAQAKDFEIGTTDYATKTTPTNLLIGGSQTWFGWVKLESIPGTSQSLLYHADSTPTIYGGVSINATTGLANFSLTGASASINSDIALQTGKWYFLCGVYDGTNITIWVNGVKKTAASTGTHTFSGTQAFSIGRTGANNGGYLDGLAQNCGVLSVALSDDQVKRLWAFTSYKGQKIRRAGGTDGTLSQVLPQNLVERLRGKTVTFVAEMYQDTASIGQISINSGSETASSVSAVTGSWVTVSCTQTISSTATAITLYLKVSTTNGNVWFKECRLHIGSSILPYAPSADDWARFPLLLQQRPAVIDSYTVSRDLLAQITKTDADFTTTSTTAVQVTGMSVTIAVEAGDLLEIVFSAGFLRNQTAAKASVLTLWDGVVASGTQISFAQTYGNIIDGGAPVFMRALVKISAAAVKTYNVGLATDASGTAALSAASAITPAYLTVRKV